MSNRYTTDLAVAIAAARAAGAHLREELHRPGGPRGSGAHADADAEAEAIIRDALLGVTPYAYLGEELGDREGADPTHRWIVDPNDGTASFLKGFRGTSVSIALLRDGEPVLGVVYAYACPDDEGDLIAWAEGEGPVTRNGIVARTDLTDITLLARPIIIVSQDADRRPVPNAASITAFATSARYLAMPSIAYRLALVAAGAGVAATGLAGVSSWDFAAGHALLRGAGGALVDQDGAPITYDARGRGRAARCFGGAPALVRSLAAQPWDAVLGGTHALTPAYALERPRLDRLARDTAALRRAQGCLLGQLAGDALGSRVEFESAARIVSRHPGGVRDLVDGGTWDTIAGQPTDDSELALMLARSITKYGGYDPAAALDAYVHWLTSRPFDIGGTTIAALRPAAATAPAERLAIVAEVARHESQANGSLMRASPLGILGARRPREAAAWARADSGLTHPHPVCRESCAAFVTAIVAAIGGADPEGAWSAARAEAARGGEPTVIEVLDAAVHEPPARFDVHQGWVKIALQNAFYQLLHAPSLEEGVIATVMAGGDTDTNAAIAGALLGAVHGRDAVPMRWRSAVITCRPMRAVGAKQPRPPEMWPVDAMILGEALLALGSA
ncbi:ADP-ribosylglycohydrolase [Minicystis rosea]|nr:ADP-ribosylglycohydrolase [Minicystis rosea]